MDNQFQPSNDSVLDFAEPPAAKPKQPLSKRNLIILIAVGVVVLAGLGVGAYFLFRPAPAAPADDTGTSDVADDTTPIPVKSDSERMADYDQDIANAQSDDDRIALTLDKVMTMVQLGYYGDAIAQLQEIDLSTLNTLNTYRVYAHFAYVYETMGDADAASEYRTLSDDAYDRYILEQEASAEGASQP